MGLEGDSASGDGVTGTSSTGNGVHGINGQGFDPNGAGLGQQSTGVFGESSWDDGVFGASTTQNGVHGLSGLGTGTAPPNGCGVYGEAHQWPNNAVFGSSNAGHGVHGINGAGSGTSPSVGCGVWGESAQGNGVYGASKHGMAGVFEGKVSVSGDISAGGNITITGSGDLVLTGADCAEQFDVCSAAASDPGTVLVIDQNGGLEQSLKPYDRRVAGVVSGAGSFKSGILLDRRPDAPDRTPVALVGKVYCKVDASSAPIEIGDLLTSSATPGHAMKAADPFRAFGAVIGKALQPLASGRGLVAILVALQ